MSRILSDEPASPVALVDLPDGLTARVTAVVPPQADSRWAARLEEIGFIPGEQVRVLARARPGGDPLSVRIGCSTFALRRIEAACVQVVPGASQGAGAA